MTGVPYDDRGLLLGDGLFETVLALDGALVLMPAHVRRMRAGARAMGLPVPSAVAIEATATRALADAGLDGGRAAVRITLTAGSGGRGLDRPDDPAPRLFATAAASPAPRGAVSLAIAPLRRNDTSPTSRWKTLAYLDPVLARRQAQALGADDALMLNTRGRLACAAAANLFWIADGRLFTPRLDCGVLEGVMRGQVLVAARSMGLSAAEVAAGPEALEAAQAAFVTSSLIGVRAVSRIGGLAMDADAPALAALAAAVCAVTGRGRP